MNTIAQTTDELIADFRSAGIRRAYLVWDDQSRRLVASHRILTGIRDAIAADRRDFDRHEGLFFEVGAESGHLMSACVHRTRRGQGAGGVRFWSYDTVEDFVRDGLRLSRGMGRKCALAGLWWGGGKGVIARRADVDHLDPEVRRAVFEDYGRFVSGLQGLYVTAEDVGTTPEDMVHIHRTTRFTTCVPRSMGGSGNPSILTARGVVVAMEAALKHLDMGSLAGKHIVMQGAGNVSRYMMKELLDRDVGRIDAVDIDERSLQQAREMISDERVNLSRVEPGDNSVFGEACDVLAPNAVGGTVNPETIPLIEAPIVCGAANNSLADPARDARELAGRNILYVPDFLANRMGIVNCANEQYGYLRRDEAIESHLSRNAEHGIYQRCLTVFERARTRGVPPTVEAQALADELSMALHPIWGHRGQAIINDLVSGGWVEERSD